MSWVTEQKVLIRSSGHRVIGSSGHPGHQVINSILYGSQGVSPLDHVSLALLYPFLRPSPPPSCDQANRVVELAWKLPGGEAAAAASAVALNDHGTQAPGSADDASCMQAYREALRATDEVILHAWRVGDLVAWSNRLVIHSATSTKLYPAGSTRIHHRIRLRAADSHRPAAWRAGAHQMYEDLRAAGHRSSHTAEE